MAVIQFTLKVHKKKKKNVREIELVKLSLKIQSENRQPTKRVLQS